MDPRKIVGFGVDPLGLLLCRWKPPCIFIMVTVVGGISYHNLCITDLCTSRDSLDKREPSFGTWHVVPLFCMSLCLPILLSANPPPAEDWCAWMIYGSDCQGLLKPIQFQDSDSHFLSFMAHLMNSHHQLTCFIIVKTLIEVVVLKKNMEGKKKNQQSSFTTFSPLCPKLLCLRFPAPSFSHSATCWPCKRLLTLVLQSCTYIC